MGTLNARYNYSRQQIITRVEKSPVRKKLKARTYKVLIKV